MKIKSTRIVLATMITLVLALATVAWADMTGDSDLQMSDSGGNVITDPDLSAVGGFSQTPGGELVVSHQIRPPSRLTREDYQKVYNEAQSLLEIGVTFRTTEIQVVPATTVEQAMQNYQDFNDGEYFYRFCANYDEIQVNPSGYCPESDPSQWPNQEKNIRNQLIRARDLFAVLLIAQPDDLILSANGTQVAARELGREGLLATTREMANIHMIFGHEFLVDALDYRFGTGATPDAQLIILQEIGLLELAFQQVAFAVDSLTYALNANLGGVEGVHIASYFTAQEFELFGLVSEKLVITLNEKANRYRLLGQNDEAMSVYTDGSIAQYIQAFALAYQALEQNADFLEHGGWQMRNNLEKIQAQVQAIHDGLNPFGFADQYVPLHTYDELYSLTQNDFLRDASEDEEAAKNAQREFDVNGTALRQELQSQRLTYNNQLLDLCGASGDDFVTCEGGLMAQNASDMNLASKQIDLAEQRLANIPQQIQIEQDRAGQVINITLEGGQALSALSYAIGVRGAYKVTKSIVDATSEEWYSQSQANVGFSLNPADWFSAGVSASTGYKHSRTKVSSVRKEWDPAAVELSQLNGLKEVQQAATSAQIVGANSEATIRQLLLQQAELMIQLDIALEGWNRVTTEHNHLVEKYHNLLNLRAQAQEDLVDSYLNNPAYRILRDTLTVEAGESHQKAAQFAYLTAKSLEYEFLQPVPFVNDIFKSRSADNIDNFLLDLQEWKTALGNPGQRNRFPYQISVAKDLLGLTNENIDPNNELSPSGRAQRRYQLFQDFLQLNLLSESNIVEFEFITSIEDNNVFSTNIWNNRIAGINLPANVPGTEGVSINIQTRQFGDAGTPAIILTHGGHASYRTITGEIVEYIPGPTRLVGFPAPAGFQQPNTSALIFSSVNGNGEGTPTSALFNLSIAASNWKLRIDLNDPLNRELDIRQIEDIEILMDSTAIALPGLQRAAQEESRRLIEGFEDAKKRASRFNREDGIIRFPIPSSRFNREARTQHGGKPRAWVISFIFFCRHRPVLDFQFGNTTEITHIASQHRGIFAQSDGCNA